MTEQFDVTVLQSESPGLEGVIQLWGKSRSTLGLFPRGAFEDYAARGQILLALSAEGESAGYLLYRVSRNHVVIVHLCVAEDFRGQGIARILFTALRERTQECQGVKLRCRRDYEADSLWPKLGFHPVNEKPGRSQSGNPVTVWLYDYGHPSLFSQLDDQLDAGRFATVLDANVVYDLQDPMTSKNEESKALLADWLQSWVELCVTEEMYHEIHRAPASAERERRRKYLRRFRTLKPRRAEEEKIAQQLRPFFPDALSSNDESDLKQLAKSIAADAVYFVTRDDELLDRSDFIYEQFGISVVRPCELIVGSDERERASEYLPARLAGSLLPVQRVTAEQISKLVAIFQDYRARERKVDFQQRLRSALSTLQTHDSFVVVDAAQHPLALYTIDHSEPGFIRVPVLRVGKGPLARSIARHILWKVVTTAAEKGCAVVEITGPYLPEGAEEGLRQLRFTPSCGAWTKYNLTACDTYHGLAARVEALQGDIGDHAERFAEVAGVLRDARTRNDPRWAGELERVLWPAKIVDSAIPNFIVPIKAVWAAHLFDEALAHETLFGSEPQLALSVENVYYRSAVPRVLEAPARILWYVSRSEGYSGSMSIRAASHVREVIVGPAKELYRRFRRLGIYQWRDVSQLAARNPRNEMMAFVFTHTETFSRPIPWSELQGALTTHRGKGSQLQGPLAISGETFLDLYRRGIQVGVPGGAS